MVTNNTHRQVRVGAVGADLLAPEQRSERRERGGERDHAAGGHAGGDGDHVLLGDAHVDESIGMTIGEVGHPVHLGQIGGEHGDARIVIGQVGPATAEDERRDGTGVAAVDRACASRNE